MTYDSYHRPPTSNTGLKRLVLWVLCVMLAATPLLIPIGLPPELAVIQQRIRRSEAVRTVTGLATGDIEPLRKWVEQQTLTQLMIYGALTMCFTVWLALRR